MENPSLLQITANLLITRWFRWLVILLIISLLLYSYIQDPIRFSKKKLFMGINHRLMNYISIMFTLIAIFTTVVGMWYTIPFSKSLPEMWYVPIMILAFAFITQEYLDTVSSTMDESRLNAPPEYMLPRSYRIILMTTIVILSAIMFLQNMLYAGIAIEFRTTILHQYFLNRFGGSNPSNILKFMASWLGILAVGMNLKRLYEVRTFTACKYELPASWNF